MEPVDAAVIQAYRLYPVIVQHYSVHAAFAQKVSALALRQQVQSRDVFDLKLLLDAGGSGSRYRRQQPNTWPPRSRMRLQLTMTRLPARSWHFWSPNTRNTINTKAWAELQEQVVDGLEALRR